MKNTLLLKYQLFCGIIDRTLKYSQYQKHTKPKIYHTLALSNLLDGCEIWESYNRINLG